MIYFIPSATASIPRRGEGIRPLFVKSRSDLPSGGRLRREEQQLFSIFLIFSIQLEFIKSLLKPPPLPSEGAGFAALNFVLFLSCAALINPEAVTILINII
jgi:hypothetical protein